MLSDMGCYDVMSLERIERDGVEEKRKEEKRREEKRKEESQRKKEEKKRKRNGRVENVTRYDTDMEFFHPMQCYHVM